MSSSEERLLKTAYPGCAGCKPENCRVEAKVKARRQCQEQEGERIETQGPNHRALASRVKGRTQWGSGWVDRAKAKASHSLRALGRFACLPVRHTLRALLIQCQHIGLRNQETNRSCKSVPVAAI